jgi:putative phosphoesterase
MKDNSRRIGLISDTHDHFDPQLSDIFADCDEIWHAGDIGNIDIIQKLKSIKPVRAVYGNIDDLSMQHQFPEDLWLNIGELLVYITHIAGKPPKYNARVLKAIKEKKPNLLICGHSHILRVMPDKANNLMYINPGAAGQHGFHTIRTVIKMTIADDKISDMAAVELGRRGR